MDGKKSAAWNLLQRAFAIAVCFGGAYAVRLCRRIVKKLGKNLKNLVDNMRIDMI